MSVYYIAHHGIKGQKWGVRRWQSKDGSYNAAGEKRYGIGDGESYHKIRTSNKNSNQNKSQSNSYSKKKLTGKQKARIALGVGAAAAGVGLMAYGVHKSNQASQARSDAIKKAAETVNKAKDDAERVEIPKATVETIKVPRATVERTIVQTADIPVVKIPKQDFDFNKLSNELDGFNQDLLRKNMKDIDDYFKN